MSVSAADPVLVEVLRGSVVESVHRGAAVVADARGRIVAGWGESARPTYPRSAIKPLQALPLIETGAAGRFGLGEVEIALACASHGGEPGHVAAVADWLRRMNLGAGDLECGAHWPSNAEAARALARAAAEPGPLHNNCSGKHAGFLAGARHLGEDTAGYIERDHPVQRRVAAALSEMCGHDLGATACGVDGCGIPTFALPLSALATGMARLADPAGLGPARIAAAERIRAAMAARPWFVAGTGRLCTAVMQAAPLVLVKTGAEGVYAAALPRLGLGVALKVDDGAGRASEVALLAVLNKLDALTAEQAAALAERARPELRNVVGRVVGELRPAF